MKLLFRLTLFIILIRFFYFYGRKKWVVPTSTEVQLRFSLLQKCFSSLDGNFIPDAIYFRHWNRLLRVVLEPSFLEAFKRCVEMAPMDVV